jgi:DNA-binding response OmpR family regulator
MNGFSAKFFTCPLKALAAARSESRDLVILVVAMPGISGIAILTPCGEFSASTT